MAESVQYVKDVAEFLRVAGEKDANSERGQRLISYADVVDSAAAEISRLRSLTSALPPDLGDIHDLPQELIDELSAAKTDELEDQLVTVINSYGGEASLDQILVGLYRKFKAMQKRRFIQNKLYRMEAVWSVDGKKGFYTTQKPEDPQDSEGYRASEGYSSQSGYGEPDDETQIPF